MPPASISVLSAIRGPNNNSGSPTRPQSAARGESTAIDFSEAPRMAAEGMQEITLRVSMVLTFQILEKPGGI